MSKLLAPNGKPSNLTPEQYKLVRSKEFISWFGDWEKDPANASKVVDENGEPLPVYHGTNTEINIFDIQKIHASGESVFKFTTSYEMARGYGKNVYSVFLSIKNNEIGHWMNPKKGLSKFYANTTFDKARLDLVYESKKADESQGGVIYGLVSNDLNYNGDVYFVHFPNQIKLADGTNTTFDGNNPDIRFDEGGAIKKVNVVDIKQYTMGGVNYRFVEIAEKKYNKIEVYRQYEDDGKYWGVLLYRRVPRYDFKFSSPMINNLNQLFAYPFHSSSSDEELFDAVKYKKKPFGSLSYWISYSSEDEIYEKFKVFIAQCSEYNLEYSIINDKERIIFQFCQKGTFDELFNIDNLIEDYKNNGFEDVELKGIKKFRYYDLSYFLNNEWDANGLFEFPLTGLILGIPLKFTMSILNMWTTYDLSKEYKYSENVTEEKYSVGGEVKTINLLSDIWKWFGIKF